tara:strand:+ start:1038 stop:1832 length:795 start_codon:yes stop_codon:yes gene_type:complete
MKNIDMREAYLKVLGQRQEPVQEANTMGRPSWVPESIKDDSVSEFMSALVAAHKEGKETFSFSEKNYKMSFSKKKESANEAVVIDTDDSEVEQDDECEKCGEVHEGSCSTKKEELSPKQKKLDHDKDGDIDGKDLAKLRMRKEAAEIEQFAADLAENGFDQEEIDSILSKIDEAQGHVGTGGPAAAPAEELGDTLPDGELDFIEMHDIEITDLTPEDPEHSANIKKATPPVTKGVGTAEVDGQKIVASKPEVAVKSQAPVPKTK